MAAGPDGALVGVARYACLPGAAEAEIALVVEVGERLDQLVTKPLVFRMLKMMRGPARMAGMTDLQEFLEHGFEAFRAMGGAEHFLSTVAERERAIASRLFSSAPAPFSS